jgi:cardiolipin synthase
MREARLAPAAREGLSHMRLLADQALARTAGAPLVPGNAVRLLKDAAENYPAWLEAISAAEQVIFFESYIIRDDEIGNQFAEALIAKARHGVRVRVLYDWLGNAGKTSRRFWQRLERGGVQVRCFNPPRLDSPLSWVSRDHRKSIYIDHRVAFVTGLCVGSTWVGDAARGLEPWRDTGVEIRGPAVADVARAFAEVWAEAGPPLSADERPPQQGLAAAGDVMLRVVAGVPSLAGIYRLDQLIAAVARKTLWLTDAYFVGSTSYVQALRGAALDGVDVRLLVPGASDIKFLVPLSRAGYRPLLEAGVRVFEWNGRMLHAKTAVADGRWARVGSTNLNLASWIGNWELDVAVEDEAFAAAMQEMYLQDLTRATEIVLGRRQRVLTARPAESRGPGDRSGSAGRLAAGAISVSNTIGAAITNRRLLGAAEAKVTGLAGLILLALAGIVAVWPWALALPFTVCGVWIAAALLLKAYRLHHEARARHLPPVPPMKSRDGSGPPAVCGPGLSAGGCGGDARQKGERKAAE